MKIFKIILAIFVSNFAVLACIPYGEIGDSINNFVKQVIRKFIIREKLSMTSNLLRNFA